MTVDCAADKDSVIAGCVCVRWFRGEELKEAWFMPAALVPVPDEEASTSGADGPNVTATDARFEINQGRIWAGESGQAFDLVSLTAVVTQKMHGAELEAWTRALADEWTTGDEVTL